MSASTDVVDAFIAAWPSMDVDRIMDFFTEDAVYTNIPIDPPNAGKEAIRKTIETFAGMAKQIEFIVHHQTENGSGVVMNERTDRFLLADGRWAEAPVMGVFELEGGKIKAWRDYFDMAQFTGGDGPARGVSRTKRRGRALGGAPPVTRAAALRLGVVDQAPVRAGGTATDALREAVELAVHTEQLGYERYWVAEHHSLPSLAATSPEILIGRIAAETERMRVGSGGVMLTHYAALKVAENFRMLESLFPGRIDLGLGRAPGGDGRTARALAHPFPVRDVREYPAQVDDLMGFLADALPEGHPFAGVRAGPTGGSLPEVWLLGSGVDSALIAAERGLPFGFAHFFGTATEHGPAIAETYRKRFRPSAEHPTPRLQVALGVLCAETEDEVAHHAAPLRLSRIHLARGIHRGLVSPEEAAAHVFTPEEIAYLERTDRSAIQGTPGQVAREIEALADRYGTREIGIVTICHDFAARKRSYTLVAETLGIAPPG